MSTAVKETSTNALNRRALGRACVMNDVLARVSLRWKMQILFAIHSGHRNFAALKRHLSEVSDHVLAHRLGELVDEGLAVRDDSKAGGARVRYAVTEKGRALLRICEELCAWELRFREGDGAA